MSTTRAYCNNLIFTSIKDYINKIVREGEKPTLITKNEWFGSKGYYVCINSTAWSYQRATHRNKAVRLLNDYIENVIKHD